MLSGIFVDQLYKNIANSLVASVVILTAYAMVYFLLIKKIPNSKIQKNTRVRVVFSFTIIFIFIIAKIWVAGFTQLLALFSLISAGLVIANKELVMNFMGWFIINWRSIFSEGDYVEIEGYRGYVYKVGVLYFKIFEVSNNSINRTSGKTIKIPNNLVIFYPIINYTRNSNFLEYSQDWEVPSGLEISTVKSLIKRVSWSVLSNYYQNIKEYTPENLAKRNLILSRLIELDAHVSEIIVDNTKKIRVCYYCYPKDFEEINLNIISQIEKQLDKLLQLKQGNQDLHNSSLEEAILSESS